MRAICCAILALVFCVMAFGVGHSGDGNRAFRAGISASLCYVFIAVSIILCWMGL